MQKKYVHLLVSAALAACSLAGCGSNGNNRNASSENDREKTKTMEQGTAYHDTDNAGASGNNEE